MKCKNCGVELTKFDKEFCPHCGEKNPILDFHDSSDTTQTLDKVLDEDKNFKIKSFKLFSIFLAFLGFFAAELFYIGKIKQALINLSINIVLYVILFMIIYFSNTELLVLALLLPFAIIFAVYLILGIIFYFKKFNIKDKFGVYLK